MRGVPSVLAVVTLACCVAQATFLSRGGMSLWGTAAFDHGFPLLPLSAGTGAVVGALILGRHPKHPIGWLFSLGQLGTAGGQAADAYGWAVLEGRMSGSERLAHAAAWFGNTSSMFLVGSLALLTLLAPDGRLLSRRWRYVGYLVAGSAALFMAGLLLVPPDAIRPTGATSPGLLATVLAGGGQIGMTVALLLGGFALLLRLRRAMGEERQQLRWIAVAATMAGLSLMTIVVHNLARGGNVAADARLALMLSLAFLGIPVATGFAVLRYRLYDIDLVIRAAVKAGVLATFVTIGYITVVAVTAGWLGQAGPPSFVASLLALVVVAIAFQPLRRRLRNLADRVVYGRRADPYEALARFSRSLAERVGGSAVLPRFAEAVASATGALQVQASLPLPDGVQTAMWPEDPPSLRGTELVLPVRHGGDQIGEMLVKLPPAGSLSGPQRRLTAELAEQAGLAFHNVRLDASLQARVAALARDTAELAASRRRLVAAEDVEREHLVRAIQRDVSRYLHPLPAALDRLPDLLRDNPSAAERLLEGLEENANRALDALRELSHGLFPTLLATRGMSTALEAYLQRRGQPVDVDIAENAWDHRLPAALEAAGYFCAVEALTVLGECRLAVAVGDDGMRITCSGSVTTSLPPDFEQRLTDRAEAVGGSVAVEVDGAPQLTVRVYLPTGPTLEVSAAQEVNAVSEQAGALS
ncbi:MAG TPA: hypothetical protein VFP89_04565 [Propionibacteriaceae bacterium]|nr:hypothetical protein [Propionibacteriaceae bacterium]